MLYDNIRKLKVNIMNKNNNFEPKENKYTHLPNWWNDDRVPVNKVIETNSDKNHDYYGRFETYQGGGHRSFQQWTAKSGSNLLEIMYNERDPFIANWLKVNAPNARKLESVSGNIYDTEWINMWSKEIDLRPPCHRSPKENSKNEFIHTLETNYSPERHKIEDSLVKNTSQSNLIKENDQLKQQLNQVQQKLAEVLAELKNLKGENNDQLVNKLTQTQEQNQQLISTDNISVSEVQEQVQKSEALLREVGNFSFTPSSNEKGHRVMPYLVGGSFLLAISGIAGLLLLRKRKLSN